MYHMKSTNEVAFILIGGVISITYIFTYKCLGPTHAFNQTIIIEASPTTFLFYLCSIFLLHSISTSTTLQSIWKGITISLTALLEIESIESIWELIFIYLLPEFSIFDTSTNNFYLIIDIFFQITNKISILRLYIE